VLLIPVFHQAPHFFLVGQLADQFIIQKLSDCRSITRLKKAIILPEAIDLGFHRQLRKGSFQVQKQPLPPLSSKSHSPWLELLPQPLLEYPSGPNFASKKSILELVRSQIIK
jgi:hypothetical protein